MLTARTAILYVRNSDKGAAPNTKIIVNNVEINQSTTTTIKIPRPGILNLLKSANGYGSVYLRKSATEEVWVTNLNDKVKNETIVLQPGKYRVVFRAQNARQTLYTINKTIEIRPGSAEVLQLY